MYLGVLVMSSSVVMMEEKLLSCESGARCAPQLSYGSPITTSPNARYSYGYTGPAHQLCTPAPSNAADWGGAMGGKREPDGARES
eukprot:COSAG04_NODE_1161_length_8022_cov_6.963019_3_plen_85_part_00